MLHTAQKIKDFEGHIDYCHLDLKGQVAINSHLKEATNSESILVCLTDNISTQVSFLATFQLNNFRTLELVQQNNLDAESQQFLQKYLPYCFASLTAKENKRATTIAHLAQSLDGKIATNCGSSRWIGNDENLIHAHRMRALCDAVLIGKNTLLLDKPKLTVRKVKGKNPIKVIVGSSFEACADVDNLVENCTDNQNLILFGKGKTIEKKGIDFIPMNDNGIKWNSETILQFLYKKNIQTVYVEGGAQTISRFLGDGMIDVLQLHISPLLFGSGRAIDINPAIERVNQSISFNHFQYHRVGDEMMFVGEPKKIK